MFRNGVTAVAAAAALAACGGHSVVPSSQTAMNPMLPDAAAPAQPQTLTTCKTSPPQYEWIFKGACEKITLKPAGANFGLQEYENITVTGLIGKNNVHGSAIFYLADATGKGDIKLFHGKAFPKYNARGTVIIYAAAVNQSSQHIKPIPEEGKPILQYVITDSKGIPGKTCGGGILVKGKNGAYSWNSLTITAKVSGNKVTISQYTAPQGFELGPKTPLYIAINCY